MKQYIKPLDSLRFLAILLVIIYHWSPLINHFYLLDIGRIGVQLFFTLSGFLITSILLAQKEENIPGASLKSFFIKRSLRIFPLYYLVVFAFYKSSRLLTYPFSTLFYGTNFNYFLHLPAPLPPLHFWSLCVEEQFYLIWPLVVLFFSLKHLRHFIIISIVFAFCFRVLMRNYYHDAYWLMPSHLDSLGIGAMISYHINIEKKKMDFVSGNVLLFLLTCYLGFSIIFINNSTFYNVHITATAFLSGIIIIYLLSERKNEVAEKVLAFPVFVYLGRISYGLYIFHPFIKVIVAKANLYAIDKGLYLLGTNSYLFPIFQEYSAGFYVYNTILLVVISSASWYLFEKPIKRLSIYFVGG